MMPMKQRDIMLLKISFLIAFFVLIPVVLTPLVSAGSVTRSFSSGSVEQGGHLTVTLAVDVNESQEDVYAIEEDYPDEWSVVDSGGLNSQDPGYLKKVVIDNASDTEYQYVLSAPSAMGNYTWYGQYLFENMSDELPIGGDSHASVTEAPPPPPDDDGGSSGSGSSPGGAACSPNWTCTEWEGCQPDGNQTRTCTDSSSCGSDSGKPEEYMNCIYIEPYNITGECVENWFCRGWSECLGGVQTRTCVDMNACGTAYSRPHDEQICLPEAIGIGGLIIFPVLIIIIAFIVFMRRK
jgi:hypothetical protein